MKRRVNLSLIIKFISISGLAMSLGTAFVFLNENKAKAEKSSEALRHFAVDQTGQIPVAIERSGSPWINLKPGEPINSDYVGDDSAINRFESGSLRPTTLAATDFNFDGYPDVISGFAGTNGGIITLHKGWNEAFAPENEEVLAGLKNGEFPVSFEKEAKVLELPIAPDFIVTGKFVKDSTLDLIVASRQSRSVYLLTSNGKDGFNSPRKIQLDGEVTAIAADSLKSSKAFSGLVIATKNEAGFEALIFDGSDELNPANPQRIQLSNETDSLILTNPDGLTTDKDLFLLGGGELLRISQIGKSVSNPTMIDLPFRVQDFATGEFIRDRLAKTEIAVLAENGSIYYLKNGSLDTRPFTTAEVLETWKENGGRGRTSSKAVINDLSDDWSVAESHQLGVYSSGGNAARTLQKVYITGNETDDLLVSDANNNRIQILFKEPNTDENRTSFTGETKFQNVEFAASPAAVLPMRLNVMGQQGFVFFGKGSLEPTTVIAAPSATFVVSKTADTNDGTCNADCSLREAVVAANGAAGADMITFTPNGTHQLTIDNAGVENASVEGDLDITQALTIVGNGAANTILQAGTNTTNGIDKVLSVNPLFTSAFATSFTGFTVRFGRNPSTFATDGFGGGFDWEGSGTGTLTISNLIVTDNSTLDGDGGGITATAAAGNSFISVTGSTISNNDPDRSPAASSPIGGGIFVGTNTTFRLTTTTVSNNNVNESFNNGQGGGLYAFAPASSAGKSFLTGSTVSGNLAPSDGGGILSTQPIDFNTPTTISNNSSGRNGGGIWVNHTNGTTVISEATMTGNSATTTGGAMYLSSATTANVLSVSFSRIVGNTGGGFRGLAVDGGTGNVENNWWGCNTGPSAAPCDTAGVVGAGTVDFNPWLRYTHTASPSSIVVGQTSTLTASFLTNSAGTAITANNLDTLIGVPIAFGSAVNGNLSSAQTTIQATGTATATFTATAVGTGTANATVDAQAQPLATSITILPTTSTSAPGCTGLAPSPLQASTTNKAVLCFTLTANSSVNFTALNVPFTTDPSMRFTNAKLFRSTDNDYSTAGDNTLVASGTISATQFMFTGFTAFQRTEPSVPELSTTPTNFFVVADIQGTVSGTTPASQPSVAPANITVSSGNLTGATVTGTNFAFTAPTAASVSVSGRVLTANGSGVSNAVVTITDSNGVSRSSRTNMFGYYRFDAVATGQNYIVSALSKGYQFTPRAILVTDELTDVNFIADP